MKYNVEIAELADHFVVAFKDKETRRVKKVFSLNHLGTDILRAFIEGKPQEELVPELAERYQAEADDMRKEISQFYAELAEY